MAADPPQPDDSDVDLSEMSEAERRREMRRQARLEAKQQKAELARIRREMEGPRSKWLYIWGAVLVFLLFVLGYGGYRFYSYYATNLAQKSFMDDYNVTDLAPLRRYASEELKQVEELKRVAEDRNSGMGTREIIEQYRKAAAALQDARQTARENQELYDTTLAEFKGLMETAQKSKLDKYATSLWASVEEALKVATQDTANVFSLSLALAKLGEGIELLKEAEPSYKAIAKLDKAFTDFEESHAKVNEVEWAQNLPDELNYLRGLLNNAGGTRQAGQWQQSAELYAQAKATIDPNLEKLAEIRSRTDAKIKEFEKLLADARAAGVPEKTKETWDQLQDIAKKITESQTNFTYAMTLQLIEKAGEIASQAQDTIRQAKEGLMQRLKDLKAIHDEAQKHEKFFRVNKRDEWHDIEKEYQAFRAWLRDADDVAILSRALKLTAAYKKLLASRSTLVSGLDGVRERLSAIEADPMSKLVGVNFPDAERRLFTLRHSVARHEKRGNFEEAAEEYNEIAGILEEKTEILTAVKKKILESQTSCRERLRKYKRGMDAFREHLLAKMEKAQHEVEFLVKENRWLEAEPLQTSIEEVVPKSRFTNDAEGTVVDNVEGVMWVRDASSSGCFNGGKIDWHKAFAWVASLKYAGFDDWRLPTEEELRVLTQLPDEVLQKELPNTRQGLYWTGVPARDVTKVLAVDFASKTVQRETKVTPHYVRPIRTPK